MTTDKRKVVEEHLLARIQSLTPKSTKNRDLYAARFQAMSDDEFKAFIHRLSTEEETLMIVSPNHEDDGLSLENNLKVGDSINHDFFTRVLISGKNNLPDHLTPVKYMVVDMPVRRLSQTSDKKIKVPKSNKVVDALTGQVTGESKGAALSGPEVQVLAAMNLESTLIEAMKYRGGDIKGRNAFTNMLAKTGSANLKTLERYASGVESTATLKTYLTAAHLQNSL